VGVDVGVDVAVDVAVVEGVDTVDVETVAINFVASVITRPL
jgi:hypothetical protein